MNINTPKEINLWEWQEEAVEAMRGNIRNGVMNQILAAPTGSGKTITSAYLIKANVEKGKRSIFICDRLSLIDQTSAVFDEYGIDHGVVQADHWRWKPWAKVQVCSAQTLARRSWPDDVSLIVVDEAHTVHRAVADEIKKREVVTIGLTATPFTKGLGKLYDAVVNVRTLNQLTADGKLAPFKVYAPSEPDMKGAKVSAGEWQINESAERAMPIIGDAVKEYLKLAAGQKFIAFGVNVRHCEELQKQFLEAGVQTGLYTYHTPDEERKTMVDEFRRKDGYITGLISVAALSKGFDVPSVECLDEETEVLTPDGWRGIDDAFSEVVAFDPDTGALSVEDVEGQVRKPWTGDMVEVAGGQWNLRVTPNHRMLISGTHAAAEWGFADAETLFDRGRFRLPASGAALPAPGVPLTDDELRFIAWFITDGGWARKYNQIQIAQSKPDMVEHIRALLDRLGLRYNEYETEGGNGYAGEDALPLHRFRLPMGVKGAAKGRGWAHLSDYLDKGLAPALLGMDDRQFRLFWHELMLGDGATRPDRPTWRGHLCIGHQVLLGRLQALIAFRGYASNAHTATKTSKGEPFWLLSWDERRYREVKPHRSVQRGYADGERVWCVQNRLGTLVVRRHGRVAVVGNCIIMCRPLKASIAEHIQILGRGLRADPENPDKVCTVLDHAGNMVRFWHQMNEFFENGVHELDDGTRHEKKSKREEEDRVKKCPKCAHVHSPRPTCPLCGHEYPKAAPIEHVPGELKAMAAGVAANVSDLRQDVYSQLLHYAEQRGYKKGFAAHKFRELFGGWPNGLAETPRPATRKTLDWIKSRQIAYAKAKAKEAS